MNLFFSIFLFALSQQISADFTECTSLKNSCEYYRCVEAIKDCGRFGYPRAFGQKYCLRFEENKNKFSKEGLNFIERTRSCLIDQLDQIDPSIKCKKIKKQSFQDHVPCYIEGGFCNLSRKDLIQLYKTVWPSLWRSKVIRAALQIKKICLKR